MSAGKYLSTRKSFFFMIVGLFVFILYLYFFVGLNNIFGVLQGVDSGQYAFFYSIAFVAILAGNYFWVASWRAALTTLSVKISMKNAFLYYWTGYFVDLVIPCETVCGEVTRLYLVQNETKENYGAIGAAGITNRIVEYVIIVTGLYVSGAILLVKSDVPSWVSSFFVLILVGASFYLAVLLFLAFSEKAAGKIASIVLRLLKVLRPKKYGSPVFSLRVTRTLTSFYSGFKTFRENPRYLVRLFVFLTTSFLVNLLGYVLVFFALGIRTESFAFYIVVYFIAGSVTNAVAGFSVGTLDILLSTIFILYGLNPALSGISAALLRTVTFWFPLIFGYITVQIVGAKKLLAPGSMEKIADYPENGQVNNEIAKEHIP